MHIEPGQIRQLVRSDVLITYPINNRWEPKVSYKKEKARNIQES